MSTIALTQWGHSAVRLECRGRRLVIDPGAFSDPGVLAGAEAVLITHEHVDHVRPDHLAAALGKDGSLQVWAPEPVVEQLAAAGAPVEAVHAVAGGQELEVAGLAVQVLGRDHARIHPRIPGAVNHAYLLQGAILHPGDSFTVPDMPVRVLLLPVAAPWLKLAESIDYLATVDPAIALPIHDAILSESGVGLVDRILGAQGPGVYRRLAPGEELLVATEG